jgi:Cu/Ag efflux protein CusF
MFNMKEALTRGIVLVALLSLHGVASVLVAQSQIEHAVVGSVRKVDRSAKTITVKMADGTEETLKYTERTTMQGVRSGAKAAGVAAREGEHVVVRYTGEGAAKTAVTVERLGRAASSVAEGTVKEIDRGTRTFVVKSGDGAEETFRLAERGIVDSSEGAARAGEVAGREGERVTVYYTEEAGRKMAHLVKRLF